MNNVIACTLGNHPVKLTANNGYITKLAAKALKACRIISETTVAFRMPGDCFGIETVSGKINYSQCYDWQVNFYLDTKKNIVEGYLSWYSEEDGKQEIGKSEIFFFETRSLEIIHF